MTVIHRLCQQGRLLAALLVGNVVVCSVAFWALERGHGDYSLLQAVYWGVVTAPTVGYGDILPTTAATMLLTMWLIVSSVVATVVAGAVLTAWLVADPFEAEMVDDTDDLITMVAMLVEHAGLEVPESVEEHHGKATHYPPKDTA